MAAQYITPQNASASIITLYFGASHGAVPLDLPGAGFDTSDPLIGHYSFNDTTADTDASATNGTDNGAASSLVFSNRGSVSSSSSDGNITIVDSGATGYTLNYFTFILADAIGAVFASDALSTRRYNYQRLLGKLIRFN